MKRTWLKEARKAAGFTRETLAREIGVMLGSVANWESGHITPRIPTQRELGRILGIDAIAKFAAERQAERAMRQSA